MKSRLAFSILRILGVTYGIALMAGEAARSWGMGRHWAWILDDFVVGAPLVIAAVLVGNPTLRRRCAFSAAWAANAGMVYSSFFTKLLEPAKTDVGNATADGLLYGAGFALIQCSVCAVASIVVDPVRINEKP